MVLITLSTDKTGGQCGGIDKVRQTIAWPDKVGSKFLFKMNEIDFV